FHRPWREAGEEEPGTDREPHRVHRPVLALRRPGLDLPVSGVVPVVARRSVRLEADRGAFMHSDPEAIRKTVRTYWMIGAALFAFTIITVAVNQVHLAVPLAITVALIIATMKGSMVAAVFMHLSHEKKWIYGSLLL